MTTLLVLLIVIPSVAALAAAGAGGRGARALALAAAAASAAGALWAVATSARATFAAALLELPWLSRGAPEPVLGVFLDPLGGLLLVVVTVIGFLTVLFSTRYLREDNREHAVGDEDQGRYYFWLLLFLAAMTGVALSANFLQLFVFWEMTTLCSWALISFYHSEASVAAGLKALVMTSIGGVAFLGALMVLYAHAGTFAFTAPARLSAGPRLAVFALLAVAAWAKAAQIPFLTWLPDAMEAPTPISAYLHAAAMVKAGVFLLARAVASDLAVPPEAAAAVAGMALLTMFVALSCYFVQDDLKRLLAYSTIAHLGYVLLGVALGAMGSATAWRGGALHIICHGFGKATLFLCVGAVAYATGSRSIAALRGLGRTMPLTALAFFIGVAAVTGIPPFACFWSKLAILAGAVAMPGAVGAVVVVLVLVESLISFAWLVHVGQRVFLGELSAAAQERSDPPPAMSATLVVLMIGCLAAPAIGIALLGR